MATVTKSIKADGGDYTTLTLWEAGLDDGGAYNNGDEAVGECYDEAYDDTVLIDGGGGIALASIKLCAASGEEGDGTAETGARIVHVGDTGISIDIRVMMTVEDLEIDKNDTGSSFINTTSMSFGVVPIVRRMLMHDLVSTTTVYGVNSSPRDIQIVDSIMYNVGNDNTGADCVGIYADADIAGGGVLNCTV